MHTFDDSIRGYEIWGRIGSGGMSEVWLGKHTTLAMPVIIKTLSPELRANVGAGDAAQRLLDEARLLARVKNPHVVRAIDAGKTEGGAPFLVEEYVDGIDLAEGDRRRRRAVGVGLPLWFVCSAMRDACEALHAAHQAGIVHRDVKPSNLFSSPEMGIRLGDFGIAVAQSEKRHESSGTLRFMAPEQLTGGDITRQTDVFGAGATACDLRYGHPPFETANAVLRAGATPRMPAPESAEEAYFQHLVRKMVERRPEDRPTTAGACGAAFGTLATSLQPHVVAARTIDKGGLRIGNCRVLFHVGDIADAKVDAIVNSANYEMTMRSGVAASLLKKGGSSIEDEASACGEQALGACIRTGPGALEAKHVIHAVSAWNEVSCVGRALVRALLLSAELGCKTVALPALGTGQGRVSFEMSASTMTHALRYQVSLGGTRIREVHMYFTDDDRLRTFKGMAEEALRTGSADATVDVGLSAGDVALDAEGATCLDTDRPAPSSRLV